MMRLLAFQAQQQPDSTFEGFGLRQTVGSTIAVQGKLGFGAQSRGDSHCTPIL
jgi:hypothetical protein